MKRPLLQRLGRAFRAAWQEVKGQSRGAYDGANVHRLLLDWITQARAADEEIKGDLRLLRARARELGRNDSTVKRYFRLLVNNVVGHHPTGMQLQAQVKLPSGELDTATNDEIESAWTDWATSPVTVDGKLTLRRFEKLILKTMACDGEAFVRIWRGFEANRHGLALQAIDADLLDETFNRLRQGGLNEIRMGVEIDLVGRPVAYHFWSAEQSQWAVKRERVRIPAEEILHLYDPERVNQTRGVTWIHSIMVPTHMLNAYFESEAVASRIAASSQGWFERQPDSLAGNLGDSKKPALKDANPGQYDYVPDGYTLKTFAPEHPTAQFLSFIKGMGRKIASGLSVFYNVLFNDAEGVTYSTMRSFGLVERDDWKSIQQDFIDQWRRPLQSVWTAMALLTGALRLPSRVASRYLAVRHRARGWQWMDPEKEVKAAVLAIKNGLGSRTSFLGERGLDIEDVLDELANEERLAEERGVSISDFLPADEKTDEDEEDEDRPRGNGDRSKASRRNRLEPALRGEDS